MTLSRSEKENLAILIVSGLLLGASSIAFRVISNRRLWGLPREFYTIQYSLAFIFLGLLILLLWKANTEAGKITLSMMVFAVSVGLALPPLSLIDIEQIIINLLYAGLIIGGGVVYYRFNDLKNTIIIAGVGVMTLEHYLFAIVYATKGFIEVGRPFFVVAVLFLTVVLYGVRNVLSEELNKTQDTSDFAQNLQRVLEYP